MVRHGRRTIVIASFRIELPPTSRDFVVRPLIGQVRPVPYQQMIVIGKNRIDAGFHGEDMDQFAYSVMDPLFAMAVIRSRQRIDTAQPGSADAAAPNVIDADNIIPK